MKTFPLTSTSSFRLCCLSVGYTIFTTERHLLQNVLKVEESVLLRFFTTLERKYHETNPYHNNVHAADVMQTTHILLNSSSLKHAFQEVEVCTALFSAAVHDVDHPGESSLQKEKSSMVLTGPLSGKKSDEVGFFDST